MCEHQVIHALQMLDDLELEPGAAHLTEAEETFSSGALSMVGVDAMRIGDRKICLPVSK